MKLDKIELRPRVLAEDGRLEELYGNCYSEAEGFFIQRWGKDEKPKIVQLEWRGQLYDHWFYHSETYIAQTLAFPELFIQPFVGPTDKIEATRYLNRNYSYGREEQFLTELLIEALTGGR